MKKLGIYIQKEEILAFEDNKSNRSKYSHVTKNKTKLPTWTASGDKLDQVYQIIVKYSAYDELRIHVANKKVFKALEYGRTHLHNHKRETRSKLTKIYSLIDRLGIRVLYSPVGFPSSKPPVATTSQSQQKRSKKYKNRKFNKRGLGTSNIVDLG